MTEGEPQPQIHDVSGYDIIEASGVFKVYTDDEQVGPDFATFAAAAEYAFALKSRISPAKRG